MTKGQRTITALLAVIAALGFQGSGGGGIAAGEVIGYTTNALIQHNTELSTMVQASADLVIDGPTLVPVNALNSIADLAGLDRLVVGVISPNQVLSTAQVDVIEEFVNNGGKLVYLGENFVFFNINTLAELFYH